MNLSHNSNVPKYIGHRGYGAKEYPKPDYITENTVASFMKAYEVGLKMVEFDVQLTKDLIPVVYHDWRMFEGSSKMQVALLNLEEFMQIGILHNPPITFTTLENIFKVLPNDLSFNIEIKYPLKEEIEFYKLKVQVDIKNYVEIIQRVIDSHANCRNYFVSSFHPDVCLATNAHSPTMFLTTGGEEIVSDERCNGIEAAIKFGLENKLIGIVSDSKPLVANTSLIKTIKDSGLYCISYGKLNNERESVKLQIDAGIDGIILDESSLASST